MIKVFFDTDCICSFLWVQEQNLIHLLYPDAKIYIVKEVYNEIYNPRVRLNTVRTEFQKMESNNLITVLPSRLVNTPEYLEYLELTTNGIDGGRAIGKGEASTIIEAKKQSGIVASNNLRDVKYYTDYYNLQLITASDIIKEAFNKRLITIADAENIWQNMIQKRRQMPTNTFQEYLDNL